MTRRTSLCSPSKRFINVFGTVLASVSRDAGFGVEEIQICCERPTGWWVVKYPKNVITKAALAGYLIGKKTGWMITGR